jgi:phosphonate transport system substrate-binding protein
MTAFRMAAAALLALVATRAHAFVLGVTEGVTYRATDNQTEARFAPIAEALGKALKQPVTVKVLSSYDALRAALKQQEVDLAFVHPAHVALQAVKSGQYRTLLWTAGFTEYKVYFLCKDAQPIADWAGVVGRSFVMPDPDSITAQMTRAMLREHGVQEAQVKLQTTRYQDAVPFYVENGFAAFGATAAKGVIKDWKDKGGKTCAESRGVPIKQWIASTQLDAATVSSVREALMSMPQSDAGKKALSASGYTGFIAPSNDLEAQLTAWLGL